jgi:hypothetical protein
MFRAKLDATDVALEKHESGFYTDCNQDTSVPSAASMICISISIWHHGNLNAENECSERKRLPPARQETIVLIDHMDN